MQKASRGKLKAWQEITNSFNAKCGKIYRDTESLRNKWSQMKKNTKKKASENKKEQLKTGGGPPFIQTYSDTDIIIMDILGEQIVGLDGIFDSDVDTNLKTLPGPKNVKKPENNITHVYGIDKNIILDYQEINEVDVVFSQPDEDSILSKSNSAKLVPHTTINTEPADSGQMSAYAKTTDFVDIENAGSDEIEIEPSQNWSHYSAKMLKGRRHTKLKTNQPVNTQKLAAKSASKINETLAQTKLEFVLLQREKFLEEHNLKMKILEKQLEYEERRAAVDKFVNKDKE